jgi:hypothetical protein
MAALVRLGDGDACVSKAMVVSIRLGDANTMVIRVFQRRWLF